MISKKLGVSGQKSGEQSMLGSQGWPTERKLRKL